MAEFITAHATFKRLIRLLEPYIGRQDTRWRECVEGPLRVAIGLSRLARGATYDLIGDTWSG